MPINLQNRFYAKVQEPYTRQHNKLYTHTVKAKGSKRSIGHEGAQIYNLLLETV